MSVDIVTNTVETLAAFFDREGNEVSQGYNLYSWVIPCFSGGLCVLTVRLATSAHSNHPLPTRSAVTFEDTYLPPEPVLPGARCTQWLAILVFMR